MNCQAELQGQLPKIREMIKLTEADDHEHAYAFGQDYSSAIVLGDCNDVPRPVVPNMIGTVHNHTIDYSRFSDGDIDTFLHTKDKIMCYVVPKEGTWHAQCIDRDLGVCGEVYL